MKWRHSLSSASQKERASGEGELKWLRKLSQLISGCWLVENRVATARKNCDLLGASKRFRAARIRPSAARQGTEPANRSLSRDSCWAVERGG